MPNKHGKIPNSLATSIARTYNCDQIVVVAYDAFEDSLSFATFGSNPEMAAGAKRFAARMKTYLAQPEIKPKETNGKRTKRSG
jgi:hypothetical protein